MATILPQGSSTTAITNAGAYLVDGILIAPTTSGAPSGFPGWYPGTLRKAGAMMYDPTAHIWYTYDGTVWSAMPVIGYIPENIANKATDFTILNNTLYPTTQAVANYVSSLGGGTVTKVSVVTANGVSGTVANDTSTPAITLTLGAITPTSVNGVTATEIGYVSGVTSSIQTQLNGRELTSNKSTTTTLGTSNTLYPTQNAVKVYVDNAISSVQTITKLTKIASAGTTVSDAALNGKTILFLAVGDFFKVLGYSLSGTTITFTDGTTLDTGDTVTIFYQ